MNIRKEAWRLAHCHVEQCACTLVSLIKVSVAGAAGAKVPYSKVRST